MTVIRAETFYNRHKRLGTLGIQCCFGCVSPIKQCMSPATSYCVESDGSPHPGGWCDTHMPKCKTHPHISRKEALAYLKERRE